MKNEPIKTMVADSPEAARPRSAVSKIETEKIRGLEPTIRIKRLKERMLSEPRFISIEQAMIITETYKKNEDKPRIIQRALALRASCEKIAIRIEPGELIVGNRTSGVRSGVVFPEAGIGWVDEEFSGFPSRPQDKFNVRDGDIETFRREILPYWKDRGLRDEVERTVGTELKRIERVVKINQKDHAQGHICPHMEKWIKLGPAGIKAQAEKKLSEIGGARDGTRDFYESVGIALEGSQIFIRRYGSLAREMAENRAHSPHRADLLETARICFKLAEHPAYSFHEAVQSAWFLYVLLQLESNASSFSPGRMDQFLYPYFERDYRSGKLTLERALEIVESLWLKFNQIVYLRNSTSAKYFAGFPIGINVAIGGRRSDGGDASNTLSYLMLKAQADIGLPQPNLSARLHEGSPDELVEECARVIGLGSGMPQIFNDESVIPALENRGISSEDAANYAIVGCVELTTHGNSLGWSDAAMFNMVKCLELAVNDGKCLLTGDQLGPRTGFLDRFSSYGEFEEAYRLQLDYFIESMIRVTKAVDNLHARVLPSPFLSSVIDDCIEKGLDVTAGGARYNLSGIQAIQVANVADSLAVIKKCLFEEKTLDAAILLEALRHDWMEHEELRQRLLNRVPKYGNDVEWVDAIGLKWIEYFAKRMSEYTNVRGGPYHAGLYTVSAHVPMGRNVGATPDGRNAREPLADGGMSAVYGRDKNGPTALLRSVSRIDSMLGSNGTLLNMKFLPDSFKTESDIKKFASFLRTFVALKIHHVQFNVIRREDLVAAKVKPELYKGLTVRVAGYTAYFTELASDLQDEIIERTCYCEV